MNGERIRKMFSDKRTRLVLVLLGALLLLLLVWKVFFPSAERTGSTYQPTEQERRLAAILSKIDGVESATVMINLQDGSAVGAVVVFEGEDKILTRMRMIDVAASALGIDKNNVLVCPAEQ